MVALREIWGSGSSQRFTGFTDGYGRAIIPAQNMNTMRRNALKRKTGYYARFFFSGKLTFPSSKIGTTQSKNLAYMTVRLHLVSLFYHAQFRYIS